MITGGDLELIRQIRAELEALAEKWNLELTYHREVGGRIVMRLGVQFDPAPAALKPEQEANGSPGESRTRPESA